MAANLGQTVTEGLTSMADTVSSWLSGPLDGESEPATPHRQAGSLRYGTHISDLLTYSPGHSF